MRVLAYTSPARGHLYPIVPILDELAARGHSVGVRTLASQVDAMAARGFDAAPIAADVEAVEHDDYRARTPPGRLKRTMETFAERATKEIPDVRAAIAAFEPDALLVDTSTWGAAAVAEAWGGPWALWFPYPLPLPSRDVPPFGPGFRPATNGLTRARDAVGRELLSRFFGRVALPPMNATRRSVGLTPYATAEEPFTSPPLLLYMTAEPFEYPRSDWPANVRMVGPCAWEPPSDPPAWLQDVDRPLILVSTSSEFQDDGRLVRVALEALADEDVFVVATLPSAEPPASVPANARIERFVAHSPILQRAACAITHGGAGATQKALAAGVPVCVVPFGRDQPEVARRVEMAGAGTRLPLQRLNAQRLRTAVREAMTKAEGARRVAAGYEATGGARTAVDALEALAAQSPRGPHGVVRSA